MTRFVDPNDAGSDAPGWGDRACFISADSIRVFSSADSSQNRPYHEYVRISPGADEYALARYGSAYSSASPCSGYATYGISGLPSSVQGGAIVSVSALVVVAAIFVVAWTAVRPLFPTHLFTGLRR